MRVVVFVVAVLIVATTSEASSSCLSKGEARRHFGSVHIYWHGADHCWDATSVRLHHRLARNVERDIDRPKRLDFKPPASNPQDSKLQDAKPQDSKYQDSKYQASIAQDSKPQDSEPQASKAQTSKPETSKSQISAREHSDRWDAKWRAAMSKMTADDEPVSTPVQGVWKDRWVDIEPRGLPLAERWVDVAPVTPALSKSVPDPELRMMVLALVFIVVALMLAVVEVLFRPARGPHRRDRAVA